MYLTLNQAAQETGKSKATISRYLKNGKLSYKTKNENGYQIDPAELFRVFQKKEHKTGNIEQTVTPVEHSGNSNLEAKVQMLEALLESKNSENEKLWQKLNEESEERRKLMMIITDQREKPPEKPVEKRKKILGIF